MEILNSARTGVLVLTLVSYGRGSYAIKCLNESEGVLLDEPILYPDVSLLLKKKYGEDFDILNIPRKVLAEEVWDIIIYATKELYDVDVEDFGSLKIQTWNKSTLLDKVRGEFKSLVSSTLQEMDDFETGSLVFEDSNTNLAISLPNEVKGVFNMLGSVYNLPSEIVTKVIMSPKEIYDKSHSVPPVQRLQFLNKVQGAVPRLKRYLPQLLDDANISSLKPIISNSFESFLRSAASSEPEVKHIVDRLLTINYRYIDRKFSEWSTVRMLTPLNDIVRNSEDTEDEDFMYVIPRSPKIKLNTGINHFKKECFQKIKIGKAIRKVLVEAGYEVQDEYLEKLVNILKAQFKTNGINTFIVRGEDIRKWYHGENYSTHENTGTLGNSCMRHDKRNYLAQVYADNPDQVSMLCMTRFGKLIGRALVWENVYIKELDKVVTFMDRVYGVDSTISKFRLYAEEKGWAMKLEQSFRALRGVIYDSKRFDSDIMLAEPIIIDVDELPYLDTLFCFDEHGFLYNNTSMARRGRIRESRGESGTGVEFPITYEFSDYKEVLGIGDSEPESEEVTEDIETEPEPEPAEVIEATSPMNPTETA